MSKQVLCETIYIKMFILTQINSFYMKGFAQTRFETEAQGHPELAWWLNGGLGSSPRIAVFSTEL